MRRRLVYLLWLVIGVVGVIFVQWCVGPRRMATVPSPDGDWVFIVERQTYLLGPPCRTFRIQVRGFDDADGSIYVQHEYESGGPDMSNMQTYWRGNTAVADFGGFRLERMVPQSDDWEWKTAASPPATSRPTTQP